MSLIFLIGVFFLNSRQKIRGKKFPGNLSARDRQSVAAADESILVQCMQWGTILSSGMLILKNYVQEIK